MPSATKEKKKSPKEKKRSSQEKTKRTALPYRLRIRCEHRDLDEGASTSTGGLSSTGMGSVPTTGKSKAQNWRQRKKEKDPEEYKRVKETAKQYSRWYHLECATAKHTLKKRNLSSSEKEEAEKWDKRKARNNETARKRMNKMNAKRRTEQAAGTNIEKPKKALTRKQADLKKKKEAEKKRKQRASYTTEKKEAILARRRELYAIKNDTIKKKILEEEKRKLKEMEDRVKALEQELQNKEKEVMERLENVNEVNNMLSEDDAVDLRSDPAKRKALERVKKSLPKRRSHNISTTLDLIQKASPKKKSAFQAAGIGKDALHEGVVEAVASGLAEPRGSCKRKMIASALSAIKKKNLQRAASRRFGISRKLLDKAWKKAAGRRAVPLATIKLIQEYYETNSNPLPEKKLVSKKTMKPRHIMDLSIAKLYQKFCKTHPDCPVSMGLFYSHRPRNVKTKAQANYIGCLCEYCENINLKLEAVNNIQKATFKDGYDVINCTMCPKPAGWDFHHPSCITRKCNKCGVKKMNGRLGALLTDADKSMVKWKRWELVNTTCYTQKGTKIVKKRKPVEKQGTVNDLVKELKDEAHPFAAHLFNKDWQNKQEKELIDKLQTDEVLGIYDFGENFKCEHQREVQSAYYSHDSSTLHPIVTYYTCPTCLKPVRESIIMISDDLTHDYHLVNAFQKKVTHHLTATRELTLTKFFRFSDGCSSQYKSRGPISDISYGQEDFGHMIHHNYSGTRHGKGASDGESGVVKKMASEAIKAGTAIISTPLQFFEFLKANATKEADSSCCSPFRRSVLFVKHEEVVRERPDRALKTVQGTRKLHSIKSVYGGTVATRNLSCFCDPCLRGTGGTCVNALYVHPWKEVQLTNGRTETSESLHQNSNSDYDSDHSTDEAEYEKIPQHPSPSTHDDSVQSTDVDGSLESTSIPLDQARRADEACTSTPTSEKIRVNAYVAVHFKATGTKTTSTKGLVYMALVTDVKDNQIQVKFMRRSNKGLYDFTLEPEASHPIADIVEVFSEPSMTLTGRAYLYQFDQQELNRLSEKFTLK